MNKDYLFVYNIRLFLLLYYIFHQDGFVCYDYIKIVTI